MVSLLIDKLKKHDILNNTYIIYTSDNGFHISNHRLMPGKRCGFEEDIHIPLIVRGPGVPEGKNVTFATSHTDLAATWWEIAGLAPRPEHIATRKQFNALSPLDPLKVVS